MKNIHSYVICLFLLAGCVSEPWDEEYFESDSSTGHENLDCSKQEGLDIAAAAVATEYPQHYEKFQQNGFSLFSPIYGQWDGQMQQRYSYKSILGYKFIRDFPMGKEYYLESIEVFLSKSCQVLDVIYFKGRSGFII